MSKYLIEICFHVTGTEDLDGHTDDLMDALHDEPNVIDPDLDVNLKRQTVKVSMTVADDSQSEALHVGFAAIRSAVHAVGGQTPGWEDNLREVLAGQPLAAATRQDETPAAPWFADLDQAVASVRPPELAEAS